MRYNKVEFGDVICTQINVTDVEILTYSGMSRGKYMISYEECTVSILRADSPSRGRYQDTRLYKPWDLQL